MKKILFTLFCFALHCSTHILYAQAPSLKMWDYRYGGNNGERLTCFEQTADGGFIIGGFTASDSGGNKTQHLQGGFDYYVVKVDADGVLQWEKDFGGTSDDLLYSVKQCKDGGYILGGTSYSGINGDKTQDNWGYTDYWIIKTDSNGVKQWDKDFGGTDIEGFYSLQQTYDGGYILGGYSYSPISGNKTQDSIGQKDYWIIKTDSAGIMLWDKAYGGTEDDWFYSLQQTADSGFIFGGFSNSNISGDKTQVSQGGYDYWIVKTDSAGNKQWDKDYGGTSIDGLFSLQQTHDGGYILGGISLSGIGGDKTQPSWGAYDYWIVKTDAIGNKQWDKDFGGTLNEEVFGNVMQTSDSGYLVAGLSYSNISGDKTENNLGLEQAWIVKTDSSGSKLWDKTVFTPGHDETGFAGETKDGCYFITTFNSSNVGGYKSQPAWNNSDDYWIVKLCDSSLVAGLQPAVDNWQFAILPNPNDGNFEINLSNQQPETNNKINVFDSFGRLVFTSQLTTHNTQLHLNLADGIYFIEVNSDGQSLRKKFVVKN